MHKLFRKKSSKEDPKESAETAWAKESGVKSPTSAPLPTSSTGGNKSVRGAGSPRTADHSPNDPPADSLGELKAKYGNLGASAGSFNAPPFKKTTNAVSSTPLTSNSKSYAGESAEERGNNPAPGVSAALARSRADSGPRMLGGGTAEKKISFFGAAPPNVKKYTQVADTAPSDLVKLGQELSLRRAKKQAADHKRQLLDRLERCEIMAAEANKIAKEVQAFIVFRVRLVGDIDGTSEQSKAGHSGASTPKPEPLSASRKRNSIRNKSSIQTATAVEDVLDRKLREGIITDAEWRVMKAANRSAATEMSKEPVVPDGHGDAAALGGNGGGGDSDDSDAEDEAVSAEMEAVLQSAVSAERMAVVVQCYCEVPREMVRRATGRVLGWGSGPSLLMTSARWPTFAPLHAHFAPQASSLPTPARKLSATASTTAANTSANAGASSGAVATSAKDSNSKKGVAFAAKEVEAVNPSQEVPKKKGGGGVRFADSIDEGSGDATSDASSPAAPTGSTSALEGAEDSGTQPSSSSSSDGDGDHNSNRGSLLAAGGAPQATPEATVESLRNHLKNDVGNAIKTVKTSEVLLKSLADEVAKLPAYAGLHQGVLAKQIEGLQGVCARDTKTLDDVRAGVLAATEKLRNLTAPQRAVLVQRLAANQEHLQGGGNSGRARTLTVAAEAAQLEMRASSYHAAPLNGYDDDDEGGGGEDGQGHGSGVGGYGKDRMSAYGRTVRQSTALDHTGSAQPQQPQDDVEDLTLFEVDVSSMEDVLRALQRFRFNVRRVVKKGAAANAATEEAIAAARAAADAVAHAAGIQLRAPWEVAADEEELARMLRLPVMGPSESARAKELMGRLGSAGDASKRRTVIVEASAAAAAAAAEASTSPFAAAAAARVACAQFGGEVVNDGHDDYDYDEDEDAFDEGRISMSLNTGSSRFRSRSASVGSRKSSEAVTNSLKLLFSAVDTDLSGEIDEEELQAAMAELGLVESEVADRSLLQAFDTDGSNTLNFDEFERLIRNRLHRTSVEPFVTHEAAYDALLRYLGIDLPRANTTTNYSAGYGGLDASAASVGSGSGSGSSDNGSGGASYDDPSSNNSSNHGALSPLPSGGARAASAPEFQRHSSTAGLQNSAEAKRRRSSVGMGSIGSLSESHDHSDAIVAMAAFPAAAKAAAARHRPSGTGGNGASSRSSNSSGNNLLRSVNSMASMSMWSSPRLKGLQSSLNLGFGALQRQGSVSSAASGYPPPLKLPMPLPPPLLRERFGTYGGGGSGGSSGGNNNNNSSSSSSALVSDPCAQLRLGLKSLQQGKFAAAHVWFRQAADQGDAAACFEVARLHDVGLGLQGTPAELRNTFTGGVSSSSSGSGGHSRRGSNYSVTEGVPQRNLPGAAYWYDAAARLGDGRAMYRLACWHTSGEGVPRDEAAAKLWMAQAAAAGVADAQYADACATLRQAAQLPPRLAEQRKLEALPSLRAASEQGHGPAALELGKLHRAAALAATKAATKAAAAAAAQSADGDAANVTSSSAGGVLEAGSEDRATALQLFEQAANCTASFDATSGGSDMFKLDQGGSNNHGGYGGSGGGTNSENDPGGDSSLVGDALPAGWKVMGVSEDAAAQCRAEAQYEVARMHREASARLTDASVNSGGGGENYDLMHEGDALMSALESTSIALAWMTQAAEDGHPDAMFDLSFMMAHGEGRLGADPVLAIQWLRRAADYGHPKAMRLMDRLRNSSRHSVEVGDIGSRPSRLAESVFNTSGSLDPASSHLLLGEDGAAEGSSSRVQVLSNEDEDELADLADAFHEEEEDNEDEADEDAKNEESRVKFAAAKRISSRLSFTSGLDALNSKKTSASGIDEIDDIVSEESLSDDEFDEVVQYDNDNENDNGDDSINDTSGGGSGNSSSTTASGEYNGDAKPTVAPGGGSLKQFRAVRASLCLDNHHRRSSVGSGSEAQHQQHHPSNSSEMRRKSSSVEWSSNPLANRNRATSVVASAAAAAQAAALVNLGINPFSAEAARALQQLEQARASLATASESLAQATRRGQRQFDALSSFEAERRDVVDRRLLGPTSDLAKLLGSASALSDLRGGGSGSVGGSAGYASSGSIGGGGGSSGGGAGSGGHGGGGGRGLLALVGATARYGTALPLLVETLQVAEASDMRAADRLEALADMWQKAAKHAHKEHARLLESASQESGLTTSAESSTTANAAAGAAAVPSFAATLRSCLAELARGMALECRKSAEQHAALALSADTARCGLSQRALELRAIIESAAQEVKRRNQGVRMAWSGVAEAHKRQARRRHAAAQILKRSERTSRAASTAASGSADVISALLQAASSVAAAERAAAATAAGEGDFVFLSDIDGDGTTSSAIASSVGTSSSSRASQECRWLALDAYRRHVRFARTSAEAAARAFTAAEDLCASLPSACAALEGDVIRRALKARARLLRRCGFLCSRFVHAHLLSPPPITTAASGSRSDAATSLSSSSSSTDLGEAALLAWNASEWSPERRSREAGGVAAALRALIDGAVLERRNGRVLFMAGLDATQTALGSRVISGSMSTIKGSSSSIFAASQAAMSGSSTSPSKGPPKSSQNRRQSGYSSGSGAAATMTQARDTYSRAAANAGEPLGTWAETTQQAVQALDLASGKSSSAAAAGDKGSSSSSSSSTTASVSLKLLGFTGASSKPYAANPNGFAVASSIAELANLERAFVDAAACFELEASSVEGAKALLPAAAPTSKVAAAATSSSQEQRNAVQETRAMPGDRALGVALSGASTAALDAAACLALTPVPAPALGHLSKSDLAALMAGGQIPATSTAATVASSNTSAASSGSERSGAAPQSPPSSPPSESALALEATAALAPPLKRASACMLLVQRRGMPQLALEDDLASKMLLPAALVLTADGKLHAFLDPLPPSGSSVGAPSSAAVQASDVSVSNGDASSGSSATALLLPDAGCFTRAMDLEDLEGSASPRLPFFTVPLSAAPNGRRTAVAKAKPGVFRVLISDHVENSRSPEGGAAAGTLGGTDAANVEAEDEGIEGGSIVLPPSLLWSTPSQPTRLVASDNAPRPTDTAVAEGPIEAILVAVGSDEDADGWIEDLLRAAIRSRYH